MVWAWRLSSFSWLAVSPEPGHGETSNTDRTQLA
jgi:hypothetical protein